VPVRFTAIIGLRSSAASTPIVEASRKDERAWEAFARSYNWGNDGQAAVRAGDLLTSGLLPPRATATLGDQTLFTGKNSVLKSGGPSVTPSWLSAFQGALAELVAIPKTSTPHASKHEAELRSKVEAELTPRIEYQITPRIEAALRVKLEAELTPRIEYQITPKIEAELRSKLEGGMPSDH